MNIEQARETLKTRYSEENGFPHFVFDLAVDVASLSKDCPEQADELYKEGINIIPVLARELGYSEEKIDDILGEFAWDSMK